jgi:hypothetical protein
MDGILGDVSVPSVAVGAALPVDATVRVPENIPPCTCYVWTVLDNGGKLTQISAVNDFARSAAVTVK